MAIISDDEVTAFIRSLISESSAKHWTDDEITLYKKFGMIAVMSKFWYMMAPTEMKSATASLSASTAYVELPTDAAKIYRVAVTSNGKRLQKLEADDVWRYSLYDDGDAATNYLSIWYLEYYDAVTDFPEALRPLIALEAVMFAKTKDVGIDVNLDRMYQRFEDAANTFLSTDAPHEPTIFGDYELAVSYTNDNPCAWLFKENKIYLYKAHESD